MLNVADPVVAELSVGSESEGAGAAHWRAMVSDPGERVFVWHRVDWR